jgi:hypothetical protein
MSRSPLEYLRHIRDETEYLLAETVRLSKPLFLADETRKRAFVVDKVPRLHSRLVEILATETPSSGSPSGSSTPGTPRTS